MDIGPIRVERVERVVDPLQIARREREPVCLEQPLANQPSILLPQPALGPHHRAALTLRYADGLPVPEVAEHLGRTVHATEALLVRARRAFRSRYRGEGPGDD